MLVREGAESYLLQLTLTQSGCFAGAKQKASLASGLKVQPCKLIAMPPWDLQMETERSPTRCTSKGCAVGMMKDCSVKLKPILLPCPQDKESGNVHFCHSSGV